MLNNYKMKDVRMRILMPAVLTLSLCSSPAFAATADISFEQSPAKVSSANRDQLINNIINISGMRKGLENLPRQIVEGVTHAPPGIALSEERHNMLIGSITDVFPKDSFVNHITDRLKKNYDPQRYAHLLQTLSTPLARRMAELEARAPSPTDLQKFIAHLNSHPIPPQRLKLLQRMDIDTLSGDLMARVALISFEANALAISDGCNSSHADIRNAIDKIRPKVEQSTHNTVLLLFAYTYRNVSDKDLQQYLKTYEDKDGKWIQGFINAAIIDELKSGMARGTEKIRQYALAHQPKKTMFAPKCPSDRAHITKNNAPAVAIKKKPYPKPGRDLRECLRFKDSAKVIACTENFHS